MSSAQAEGTRVLVLVLCVPLLAASYWPMTNDPDVEAGQKAYSAGSYKLAAQHFRAALRGEGNSDRLQFDLGTALLKAAVQEVLPQERERSLNLAIVSLRSATDATQAPLAEKARYNLGNALVLGERYDEAIDTYRELLRKNPENDDARHNLELAILAKRLEVSVQAGPGAGTDPAAADAEQPADSKGQESEGEGSKGQGSEGENSNGPGTEVERAAGEESQNRQGSRSGGATRAGSEKAKDTVKADLSPKAAGATSVQGLGVLQKLEALERRSGQLRRRNLLQKTRSRLRFPNEQRNDQ